MSIFQGTVSKAIKFAGVGLHSGRVVNLEISPQPPHSGISFRRSDIPNSEIIPAHADHVIATELCTTIGQGSAKIATIEHLMAAFFGLGIDNALVSVDSQEVPILDGSAAPFVDKLTEAGIQIQPVKRKVFHVTEPLSVGDDNQYVRFQPAVGTPQELEKKPYLEFECSIDFPTKVIGKQSLSMKFSQAEFMRLCEARTFCHVESVKAMREKGLALGGSLDNAIVVNDHSVLNTDGLRFPDEFVRHKLLDCLGDLALLGGWLNGKISLHRAGHALHAQFVKKVLEHVEEKKLTNQWDHTSICLGLVAKQIY